jgi:hypothetical protein
LGYGDDGIIAEYRYKLDNRTLLRIVKALTFLVLIILSLVIFASSMSKSDVDTEHVTCTAGALLTKGKMIYRDFACVSQMPYHPFLYAAIFKVLNTSYYLLVGRIFTVVCDILIVISIIGIFGRVFAPFPITGRLLGMAMAVVCVFNCHFDKTNGFALDHDFAILCILVSFWLLVTIEPKQRSRYLRIGAMSALLTLATCMHFTAIVIQLLFLVVLLIQHAESGTQRLTTALSFLIAPIISLILPLWTMFQAPYAFYLNIFKMPILKMQLIYKMQSMMGTTFFDKFAEILFRITDPAGVYPFLIVVCLTVLIVLGRHKLELSNLKNAVLAILIPVIFLVIALCSPQVMYENFAISIPFVIISFAYPLLYLRKLGTNVPPRLFNIASALVIACAFSQVAFQPLLLLKTSLIFRPRNWVPMKVHEIAEEVAQKTKEPKLVVTLSPLYALESGCNIYLELASGWDGCKIAGALSDSKREITNTLNPETFKEMLEERPPSGIVIHRDPSKEEVSGVGMVLFRIAKTKWPEQEYDEGVWERKEYSFGLVAYFRLRCHNSE